ncbi:hypothetical protein [uncultured phage MedDCM-OCT-S04-C714]|nr:hypothetical protein [uncultured phage MedDCM-OCT-S04-C714]
MDTNTIEVDNDVTASTAHFVVTYNAKGLITGGRALTSADLPVATSSAAGAVIPGTGLSVDGSGNINHTNVVTAGTFEKVTIDAQGHVTVGADLEAADIPAIDASKITSGTFTSARLATGAVTAEKLADSSVAKFGGAGATDNIVVFPAADFKGQFFFDEKNEDLYIHTGNSFRPITVISGNLILAGTYNANTNQLATITTQGSAAGLALERHYPHLLQATSIITWLSVRVVRDLAQHLLCSLHHQTCSSRWGRVEPIACLTLVTPLRVRLLPTLPLHRLVV